MGLLDFFFFRILWIFKEFNINCICDLIVFFYFIGHCFKIDSYEFIY